MYLKELTLNGFKSFAKKSELEFGVQITAIVGPNGSGKSNIAEAFRFVLGEQSPSRMRGKKGEDLIWGGSEGLARANRASVKIVLNNEQKLLPLDFDEVTVERVVNRDGSNEYFINGSRTRLRDIHELFASANIGLSGHHIISQGEADRILSANPKERREMVEDALGLKVYQFKKQESEKKLAKTRENIAHVESLRREVSPHLKFLARQVKKIEKSFELKERLKSFYAEYLKREDIYLTLRRDELLEKKKKPEMRKTECAQALSAAKEKLARAERDEKRDALVVLESDISAVRQEEQRALREVGVTEGQISFLRRRLEEKKRTHKETDGAPIPYSAFVAVSSDIRRTVENLAEDADAPSLRRALYDVLAKLKSLTATSVREDVSDKDERELETLLAQRQAFDGSLATVTKRETELQKRYEALRESIEAEHSAERLAEREVFEIMNEQRELEHELSRTEEELRRIERDREEWRRELSEAVALIGSAASAYRGHEVQTEDGRNVPPESIAGEARSVQESRRRELEKMKIRLEELGGADDDVLKEYNDVKARDEFLLREIEDLNQSVIKLESLIADLSAQLNDQFDAGVEKISTEFNRFFTLMFGGGSARLLETKIQRRVARTHLVEEDDIEADSVAQDDTDAVQREEERGVDLDVKLPNKRVRGLDMLSGGERALTSIALIFAMSQVNPPPFVILDETDAALDEANSRRYGDMIESLAKRSQLILITHNRETMNRAGVLYGVTMGADGISKLLSVKFEEAIQVAK